MITRGLVVRSILLIVSGIGLICTVFVVPKIELIVKFILIFIGAILVALPTVVWALIYWDHGNVQSTTTNTLTFPSSALTYEYPHFPDSTDVAGPSTSTTDKFDRQ